jgi:hypothetical protein
VREKKVRVVEVKNHFELTPREIWKDDGGGCEEEMTKKEHFNAGLRNLTTKRLLI